VKARGLWELATARLEDLRKALGTGSRDPLTATGLQATGFDGPAFAALVGMPADHARTLLDVLLAERAHHPGAQLDLVWSGPESAQSQSRDTSQVLRELFGGAERSVIVAGFAFWGASTIFDCLHERALEKGLDVEFFIHIDPTGKNQQMTEANFFKHTWPWKDYRPRVYHDARSDDEDAGSSSMHAKCVVIDDAAAFITSANFTGAAQHTNVELGVVIQDRDFAHRVAAQWRSLVAKRLFKAI
jgi:phosphatidylserine/phosphatidylglycerophosphate/cardiolipin synthase-like enzyme